MILVSIDMLHLAVSEKDNGDYCEKGEFESEAIEDFCSSSSESYIRVYVSNVQSV